MPIISLKLMYFAYWYIEKQYENVLSNISNVILDELKPIILLKKQILLQVNIFLQNL